MSELRVREVERDDVVSKFDGEDPGEGNPRNPILKSSLPLLVKERLFYVDLFTKKYLFI